MKCFTSASAESPRYRFYSVQPLPAVLMLLELLTLASLRLVSAPGAATDAVTFFSLKKWWRFFSQRP